MNCPKCGNENDESVKFCASCGIKMPDNASATEHTSAEAVFYSKGWPRAKSLAVAVVPQFDLMVDDKDFYVLRLPPSYAPAWGFFIGLIFLRLIGMLLGAAIGEAIADARRKSARNTWLDENCNLISSKYEKYIFLKIPLPDLKHHISFEKGKYLVIKHSEGTITLRGSKQGYAAVEEKLNKYVLQ
jgi:hypothetical protein